ncbi:helix-turn-helix domain-containing protein [Onishia taeanensis]|uniref:helix-turn-helix domain-containing protein n=1 Tax=Onishia taeanensis TaxID=284577 RepID=UPI000B876115|nr:helix-turn-helix domain-containing protein [Halomonas taeanensis]
MNQRSLSVWRQRLCVRRPGAKVEGIAVDLGYATALAFIAMFRRLTGETLDEYRRHLKQNTPG